MNKKQKALLIARLLKKRYAKELRSKWYADPFRVLISTILSQRSKEENTAKAARQLFTTASTPKTILKLNNKQLAQLIKPSGLYTQKAARIKELCKILLTKYKNKIPAERKELLALPGVGLKTADVVLAYVFNKPVIAVDTHVNACSKRLGLVSANAGYEKARQQLEAAVPNSYKKVINRGFVLFGREICLTRSPRCNICPLLKVCPFGQRKLRK